MRFPKITRHRIKLLVGAVIASITTHVMAFGLPAHSQEMCGLRDVTEFQGALTSPTQEATPAYILDTATAFLNKCPDRLEVRGAQLIAARAALDNGQAKLAADHYFKALEAGARLSPAQRLDQSVALLSDGQDAHAKAARNLAILDWLTKLDAKGITELSVKPEKGGLVYRVELPEGEAVEAVWMAVPSGAELPSAVVVYRDHVRAAWASVRRGAPIENLNVLAQKTCTKRTALLEAADAPLPDDIETHANKALLAYLAAPQRVAETKPGQPIASCLGLEQMFYVPARQITQPTKSAG